MNIILVEDDHLQAEWAKSILEKAFGSVLIKRISTESEFYANLETFENSPPDLFVIDVMLRWTDPRPNMQPPPEEVVKDGFYRAGLRCERKLSEREKTRSIPVILYTVLEDIDLHPELGTLPHHVTYLRKDSDPTPLINQIRRSIK